VIRGVQDAVRMRNPTDTTLVFLDDNIGSGKQAKRIFQEWLGVAKGDYWYVMHLQKDELDWLRGAKLVYIPFIGFDEGIDDFQNELKRHNLTIAIHPIIPRREDQGCFHASSQVFDRTEDRLEAEKMVRSIGSGLFKVKPWEEAKKQQRALGYGNSQKLIVFSHNTPTCTLPIFWEKDGTYRDERWMPLFPRRD